MKKITKSLVALLFSLIFITSSLSVASAANNMANVSVKATVAYNSVTLSWSAVSGATGYQVEQYKSGKWTSLNAAVKETSYKVSKLKMGTTYKFRVRAFKKKLVTTDYSKAWKEISAKPMPSKVTGLKATQYTANSIKLSWTKVSGATGYKVQIYQSSWKDYKKTTSNSLTVSSLKNGTKYKFRVLAYRTESGKTFNGSYSSAVTQTCKLSAVKTVTLSASTYDTATIKWTAVEKATSYDVHMLDGSTGKWKKLASGVTAKSYTAKKLVAGVKYTFKVVACQKIGSKTYKSADSKTVSVTPKVVKPASVALASLTTKSVKVSWGKVAGATAYQVYTSTDSGKKWTQAKSGITGTSVTINLSADTKYQIKVRAYRKTGSVTSYGPYSDVKSITTPATKVSNVKATATSDGVKVTYSKVKNATGYRVQYWTASANKWTKLADVAHSKAAEATLKGVSANVIYKFKVTPYVKNGDATTFGGDSSTVEYVKTGKVGSVAISSLTTKSAKVSWGKISGATGYQLYISTDSGKKWTLLKDGLTSTSATITLNADTKYQVKVRAYIKASTLTSYGDYSSVVSFTTPATTVSNVKVAEIDGGVKVTYSKVNNATGYSVQYWTDAAKKWTKIADVAHSKAAEATFKSLDNNVVYKFKVTPYVTNNGATTYGGDSASVEYIKTGKVGSVSFSSLTTKSVKISWGKVSGATGYQLYTSTDSGKKWTLVKDGLTSTSATITVSADTKYQVKVRAYIKSGSLTGYGAYSSVASFVTPATTVSNVKLTATEDSVKITYSKVNNATGYSVQYWTNTTNKWTAFADVAQSSAAEATLKGVENNVNYKFKVVPYVKNGSATTYGGDSATVEYFKVGIRQTGYADGYATIEWTAVNSATSYQVQYATTKGWNTVLETAETTANVSINSVKGRAYRVCALDSGRNVISTYAPITASTDDINVYTSSYYTEFSWNKVEGAKYYGIYTLYNEILQYVATTNTAKLYLEPGLTKITVKAFTEDPSKKSTAALATYVFEVCLAELDANVSTDDPYYNEKINSQILYFVSSVNRTKKETTAVNIHQDNKIYYSLNKIIWKDKSYDTDGIAALIALVDKDMKVSDTTTIVKDYKFIAGYDSTNKQYLSTFMEPSDSNKAYLYNSNDPAAWKNGFKSFKLTANADGTHSVEMVLKKEEYGTSTKNQQAFYHPGLVTTVANVDFATGDDSMQNKLTSVGETTIKATINQNGTLNYFEAYSPYKLVIAMPIDEKNDLSMEMVGNSSIKYTFTR